jgi:hypothetical protein
MLTSDRFSTAKARLSPFRISGKPHGKRLQDLGREQAGDIDLAAETGSVGASHHFNLDPRLPAR